MAETAMSGLDKEIFDAMGNQLRRWQQVRLPVPESDKTLGIMHASVSYTRTKSIGFASDFGGMTSHPGLESKAYLVVEIKLGSPTYFSDAWASSSAPIDTPRSLDRILHNCFDRAMKSAYIYYHHDIGDDILSIPKFRGEEKWRTMGARIHHDAAVGFSIDEQAIAAVVKELTEKAGSLPFELHIANACYTPMLAERYYIDTEGSGIYSADARNSLAMTVMAKNMKGNLFAYGTTVYRHGLLSIPSAAEMGAMVRGAERRLRLRESIKDEESDSATVILGPSASGTFGHEGVAGHLVSAPYIDSGMTTTFADSIGRRICPEFISMVDDPTLPGLWGSYAYDHEGIKTIPNVIIEDGVLRNYMHTRSTAHRRGVLPTGHSRGDNSSLLDEDGNQRRAVYEPRSANLIISTKPDHSLPFKELVRKAQGIKDPDKEYILFADGLAGEVNPSTGHFEITPARMFRIYESGSVEPVGSAVLHGTPHNLLKNIVAASKAVKTNDGLCGAYSGWVPTTMRSPCLLISRMDVNKIDLERFTPQLIPYDG
ncbi:TldD/PmbA family protein [Candidatus Woesearchaeota archaeon]|nr:TldD/PmbA family protein [Candidatus Woesearchaeota archaeon]